MFFTQHEKDLISRKFKMLESNIFDEIVKQQQQIKDLCGFIDTLQQTVMELQNQIIELNEKNSTIINIVNDVDNIKHTIETQFDNVDEHINGVKDELVDECNNIYSSLSEDLTVHKQEMSPIIESVDILMAEYKKAVNLSLKYTEHVHRFDQGTPRAEITSSYVDKDGKLNTEIHWNDEFVQNLIKQGFTGNSDQEVVQLWLANLLHQFRENEKG